MTRDEHTTNRPTPGGSAFQETGMSNRIPAAKAVPAASYETSETRGKLPAVPGIGLRTIIASAPRPEPVFVPSGAKYFAYDQEVGFDLYDTANEAKKAAQESIDEYRSEAAEGWNEAVENVCWGVVLGKTHEIEVHDGYDGSAGLAGCGRPVDYVLASEPVAAQPAVPDGWKMVPVEPTPGMLMAAGAAVHAATYWHRAYCAMLAAAPEAPQTIQCNACDWIGSSADAHYLGGREPIGPLCPECHETTGPADDAAALRSAIRAMAAMLQAREWAEHVSTSADPDVTDLEAQITELVGTATKLREQNAALVAALEHLEHNARSSGAEMGLALDVARAALASAKGGAQ